MGEFLHNMYTLGFPGGSDGKEFSCNVDQTWVWSPGWEDPRRRAWQPTPVFLHGESPGTQESGGLQFMRSQRDTTEGLSTAQHMCYPICIIIMVNHLRRAPHTHHLLLSALEILPLPNSSLLLLPLLLLPLLLRNYYDHHHHQGHHYYYC